MGGCVGTPGQQEHSNPSCRPHHAQCSTARRPHAPAPPRFKPLPTIKECFPSLLERGASLHVCHLLPPNPTPPQNFKEYIRERLEAARLAAGSPDGLSGQPSVAVLDFTSVATIDATALHLFSERAAAGRRCCRCRRRRRRRRCCCCRRRACWCVRRRASVQLCCAVLRCVAHTRAPALPPAHAPAHRRLCDGAGQALRRPPAHRRPQRRGAPAARLRRLLCWPPASPPASPAPEGARRWLAPAASRRQVHALPRAPAHAAALTHPPPRPDNLAPTPALDRWPRP